MALTPQSIDLQSVLTVLVRDSAWLDDLFITAYTQHYLRDTNDSNITEEPDRVVRFHDTIGVLTQIDQTLHVKSCVPLPTQFLLTASMHPIPSIPELWELLVIQQFTRIASNQIAFRYRGHSYRCRFYRDYGQWALYDENPAPGSFI